MHFEGIEIALTCNDDEIKCVCVWGGGGGVCCMRAHIGVLPDQTYMSKGFFMRTAIAKLVRLGARLWQSGTCCSKLTTSLFNVSLKFKM